jgi:hypothetical protein
MLTHRPYSALRPLLLLTGLPTGQDVGKSANMKADLLLRDRLWLSVTAKVEIVIWRVPVPLDGSLHTFKCRLALVSEDVCVMRYDNETGKGDHKHVGDQEIPYRFIDLDTLQTDFWADIEAWRAKP